MEVLFIRNWRSTQRGHRNEGHRKRGEEKKKRNAKNEGVLVLWGRSMKGRGSCGSK